MLRSRPMFSQPTSGTGCLHGETYVKMMVQLVQLLSLFIERLGFRMDFMVRVVEVLGET